jgi:hypothetical protein
MNKPDLEDSRGGEEVGDPGVEVADLGPHRAVAQLQVVHQPRRRGSLPTKKKKKTSSEDR